MIPPRDSAKWRDVVTGRTPLSTNSLALQMLLKRATSSITASTPAEEIDQAAVEVHDFFIKYEWMLSTELSVVTR